MAQEVTQHAGAAPCHLAQPEGGDASIPVGPLAEDPATRPCAWLHGAMANERVKLLVCFLGVFVCYFYYGVLQETITRGRYGHGEMFTFTLTLVLMQCASGAAFARMMRCCAPSPVVDHTAQWMYMACALTCLGAMVSGNVALQFIHYPTQVLGKSCKPISVFLLGLVFARKKYPVAKYLCVLLIVTGVTLFMYRDGAERAGTSALRGGVGVGELLLLCSLVLDGLTGVLQEHMKLRHQTSFLHMMFHVNAWSSLALALPVVFTGEGLHFLLFAQCHPNIIYHVALFAATSAMGQVFIFMTVVTFGPLTCSIFTTTRKFFTVLTSVVLFANPVTGAQWFGAVLVFLGLGLDAKFGRLSTPR
ncbi:solute carrier family 35 member B1-like isoform X2 [Petromyzon marinus]|uniref:solute carrier family 35 member B1-like isoform X2 n=1 Tax=Petromyzon marinus TaxID=7757 RepID=UPI003F717DB2